MNRTLSTILLMASLCASLGSSSRVPVDREVVNVPFAFHVQSKTLPAGQYELKHLKGTNNFTFGQSIFVATPWQRNPDPNDPKITFACYHGDCSLKSIDVPGSDVSFGVVYSKKNYTLELAPQIEIPIQRERHLKR